MEPDEKADDLARRTREAGYRLAMLCLQENDPRRYDTDPDYREAVVNLLDLTNPYAEENIREEA